ncbi:helix-turn-helix domain-containing protein [Paenibacillus thalictri]|nr:helix-turn-helix domain-containing protein [Paenibacillus thalictri]
MKTFNMMGNKDPLFYRYLISFILICAIPIMLLSGLMYGSAAGSLQEEVEQANLGKLNLIRKMLDLRLKEMSEMAARIADDPGISPTNLASDAFMRVDAVRQLSKYKANNSMVDDVFLAYKNQNFIYASSGMYSYFTFEQYFYKLEPGDRDRMRHALDDTQRADVFKFNMGSPGQRMVAFIYPILSSENISKGTVLFVVRESMLNSFVEEMFSGLQGETFILNEKGEQIASAANRTTKKLDIVKLIDGFTQTGVYSSQQNGTSYSVVLNRSDTTGWSYGVAIPNSEFLTRVFELRTLLFSLLTVVIVIVAGSAFLLAAFNYRPIRKLAEHLHRDLQLSGKDAQDGGLSAKSGFEVIGTVAKTAIHTSKKLQERVDMHHEAIREQLLLKLLNGKLDTHDELIYWQDDLKLRFVHPMFYVVTITFKEPSRLTPHLKEQLLELLQYLQGNAHVYGVEPADERWIAAIVNADAHESQEDMQRAQGQWLVQRIREHLDVTPIVAIGSAVADPLHINRSYVEASASLEHALVTGQEGCHQFGELKADSEHEHWYPIEEQIRLLQSLRQGDRAVAYENLDAIMAALTDRSPSLLMLRYVCFDIVNSFIKAVKALDKHAFVSELGNLMAFQTLEELELMLRRLIDDVCGMVEKMKETRHEELVERMISYVNQSYRNAGLSLDLVAEQCGVSVSHIVKMFREQVGSTFIDYVTELRMQEVKRLLTETSEPIKDIVQHCGYIDLPNFVRKFKTYEGVTPGEYRKLYGKPANLRSRSEV